MAKALADWKIDYFKYDFSDPDEIRRMVAAIRRAGRPVCFNSCEWGREEPWHWAGIVGCQSFRFMYDQVDKWSSPADWNAGIGITTGFDQADLVGSLIRPGCWMDADAVLAGLRGKSHRRQRKGCTDVEYRTQFSFLCLMSATLIASCDVRNMDAATKAILTNREAIAINQDSLGVPAWKARKLADLEVWQKPLSGGDWAVGLLNRGNKPATVAARWIDLGLAGPCRAATSGPARSRWSRASGSSARSPRTSWCCCGCTACNESPPNEKASRRPSPARRHFDAYAPSHLRRPAAKERFPPAHRRRRNSPRRAAQSQHEARCEAPRPTAAVFEPISA